MMRLALLFAVLVALAVPAAALGALSYAQARAKAQQGAVKHAHSQHAVAFELGRGFRFTSTKWVFLYFGQLADGRGCAAQLVVRFGSARSTKAVTYTRNEDCS
jgi:hypothetical protein